MDTVNLENLSEAEKDKLFRKLQEDKRAKSEAFKASYEQTKDELIATILNQAKQVQDVIGWFKYDVQKEVLAFIELMKEHSTVKSDQNNFTLKDSKGNQIKVNNNVSFEYDERAELGAKKIREFFSERMMDVEDKEFILLLLEKNHGGKFSENNIRTLIKSEDRYDHEAWKQGINLFKESIIETNSKLYFNIYEARPQGGKSQIVLNFSAIEPKPHPENTHPTQRTITNFLP